jgi:NAD(P)-dependent dehydrogenase (short-subunit alcohol dehydrogenase family)
MLFSDSDQYALILGGSSGIGLATAHKLAAEGLHLCLVHRDRRSAMPQIEAAWAELRSHGREVLTFNVNALQADKQGEVLAALHAAMGGEGRLRVLVHALSRGNLKRLSDLPTTGPSATAWQAAGLDPQGPLAAALAPLYGSTSPGEGVLSPSDLALTIEAMASSLWTWTQPLLAAGMFAPDARVIGLTSEGNQRAWPYYAAVSAAKATLEALVRAMARELAPHGLRTNVVQAGITDTPSLRMIPGSEQLKAGALLRNPFQRLTTPADVANVIALLCTDEAAWINGALIPVDGGERLG